MSCRGPRRIHPGELRFRGRGPARHWDPTKFAVVHAWLPARALQVLQREGLLGEGGYPFAHLSLHDASHDSLVIEFTGAHASLPYWRNTAAEPDTYFHLTQLPRYRIPIMSAVGPNCEQSCHACRLARQLHARAARQPHSAS